MDPRAWCVTLAACWSGIFDWVSGERHMVAAVWAVSGVLLFCACACVFGLQF